MAPIEIAMTVPDRQRSSGKRAGLVGVHQPGVADDIGARQHKASTADHCVANNATGRLAVAGGQTLLTRFGPPDLPLACRLFGATVDTLT